MVIMGGPPSPSAAAKVDFSVDGGLRVARVSLEGRLDLAGDLSSDAFANAARLGGIAAAAAAFEQPALAGARPLGGGSTDARVPGTAISPIFAISVGPCVVSGVPTAARATISARVPLRPGVMEAQFGGPFAAAFAQRLDLLLVYGRADEDCVLRVDDAGVHVDRYTDSAISVARRANELSRRTPGVHHILTTGPAADAGIPFANLAQFDGEQLAQGSASADAPFDATPSYVGRGGLGATVRATGVVAVTVADVRGERDDSAETGAERLRGLLRQSPRLIARSTGGTLELAESRGVPSERVPTPDSSTRHGCSGCPTPCGWSFDLVEPQSVAEEPVTGESPGGETRASESRANATAHVAARFSALQPFFDSGDVVRHVAICNAIGVDTRTAARVLEDVAGSAGSRSPRALLEAGSRENQRALSWTLEDEFEDNSAGSRADLASRVGSVLGSRGPEPMRSLALFGPRTASPEEHGARAYWNACFAAAIDLSGFCAFSAAGLIADGVVDLDELARAIAPHGGWPNAADVGPALAMMRAGETHTARHGRLGGGGTNTSSPGGIYRGGNDPDDPVDREFARAAVAYVAAMKAGVTEDPPRSSRETAPRAIEQQAAPDAEISVLVRASGPLARRLGFDAVTGTSSLDLPGGSTVRDLLEHLAVSAPRVRSWLFSPGGRAVPVVTCDGFALGETDILETNTTIDLVLVVAGG